MKKIKNAILSVYDKERIVKLAKGLKEFDIEIISTGGTAKELKENGIEITDISDYTGFPEIMNGRVKTLHPKVHGGILNVRDNAEHQRQKKELEIKDIDMVVVNLYPFEKVIEKKDVSLKEALENIDIGGPTMLRAAAKNFRDVAVVCSPEFYYDVLDEMNVNDGKLTDETLLKLATETIKRTSRYDTTICNFLESRKIEEKIFPEIILKRFTLKNKLRYGENPHQKGALYIDEDVEMDNLANATIFSEKEISYNNMLDFSAAIDIVREFSEPAVAVMKHLNPCGMATGKTVKEAFIKAHEGDPLSAFGCIIGMNRTVDVETANEIATENKFVQGIVAEGYEYDALNILKTKQKWGKNLVIVEFMYLMEEYPANLFDCKLIPGGGLFQERDEEFPEEKDFEIATEKKPTESEMEDLLFAWKVCKHVKSNAIVLAKDKMIVGVGAGQMSRLDSAIISVRKAGDRAKGAVLASDAFFPFPDALEKAIEAGITAAIQPGGSKGDKNVIACANKNEIAMIFTGRRHFKH